MGRSRAQLEAEFGLGQSGFRLEQKGGLGRGKGGLGWRKEGLGTGAKDITVHGYIF